MFLIQFIPFLFSEFFPNYFFSRIFKFLLCSTFMMHFELISVSRVKYRWKLSSKWISSSIYWIDPVLCLLSCLCNFKRSLLITFIWIYFWFFLFSNIPHFTVFTSTVMPSPGNTCVVSPKGVCVKSLFPKIVLLGGKVNL